ncbi:MAG: helix-turn-helix domain-containing protein [Acutalibacteraceae bacterium]
MTTTLRQQFEKTYGENVPLTKIKPLKPSEPPMEPITYTVTQMAQLLQISQQSVRNMIDANNIPYIQVGKKKLVLRTVFDTFIQSHYGLTA